MNFNLFNMSTLTIGVLLILSGAYRRSPVEIVKLTLKGEKITPGPKYGEEGEEGKFVPYPNVNPTTPSTGAPRVVPASSTPNPYVVQLPYGV